MTEPDHALLRASIPEPVRDLCVRLERGGFRAWVVGGRVRDLLVAGSRPEGSAETAATENDWDVATSARPRQVRKLFDRVIPTGIRHGTVTVLLGGGAYEVTTLRGEAAYTDGRHPDSVHYVDDIVDDLARRDFTVNAIAYDPLADRIVDPFGGARDLERRVLRAVGDPAERFAEDGLRVLRAARFAATLGFELAPETERAIEPSLASYRKVSAERIRDEWRKAMKAERPSRAFELMKDHGMLAITAPELLESVGCEQNRFHAFDVWEHAMRCLDGCPRDELLRVAGLLHDVGKPRSRDRNPETGDYTFYEHERIGAEMAAPLLGRLRFSNDDRDRIVSLVRHHLVCYDESWGDSAVRRWIRRVTPELLEDLYLLNEADVRAKGIDATADLQRLAALKAHAAKVVEAGAAMTVRDLAIGGHDLMRELGLRPGPILGRILRRLLEEVTEEPALNERKRLLDRAREVAEAESSRDA